MAQAWPPPKPKLKQEEFDDAVKTNIEDFDMLPEEAINSAIEEFTVQGYDLSQVIKRVGAGNTESHPVAVATAALKAAPRDHAALQTALDELSTSLKEGDQATLQEICAVALKVHTLEVVLEAVAQINEQTVAAGKAATTDQPGPRRVLLSALRVAKQVLLLNVDIRDEFDDFSGPELAVKMLQGHSGDREVEAAVAGLAEASAYKEEQNKERLVELGFAAMLLELLQKALAEDQQASSSGSALPLDLVTNCCGAIRSVVTADDDRPPGSSAFKNARMLAKQHQALKVLLGVLRHTGSSNADAAAAVLQAVRQLSANEEICKEFKDDGGVVAILDVLRSWLARRDVVRTALGALRQLANSDGVKTLLAENGALQLVLQCIGAHSSSEEVLEPALGLVANMTLRMPDIAAQAAEVGVLDVVVEVMTDRSSMLPVMRQACMVVRNLAVRNPELRPPMLEKGVEQLIRGIKRTHGKAVADVASAALRDLGLDNYNN
mmetsp:Transcript_20935/g.45788  ORF Transcript_20935/g.45788 Transcript_20935/m.45788 type:complete len:493 (-) Transcript_20935:195-1673(-)|eukprot:CAMPEP_0202901548 /NCGR_PEP_ID=MMETSP1392-20130828/14318_1 /ASSEMBLY_ACC=CAM_ASM_000868 /TAXON_ID=225041 /ORGANISM="Chlamydomonas chlamydogama, Strain SAG 11-48b" /LENGTH=492 /DNA_ID=CAMNT_0049588127 /DNA_START=150 /DNA_END=1628 /DNA_ORIENTATION=+